MDEQLAFLKAQWFWISAGVLAAGIVVLLVAWYAKHPDRSPFDDFRKMAVPATNGNLPHPAPTVGADAVEG